MKLILTNLVCVALIGFSDMYSENCVKSNVVVPDHCADIGPVCDRQILAIHGTVCNNPGRITVQIESEDGILLSYDSRIDWGIRGQIVVGNYRLAGKDWDFQTEKTFNYPRFPWTAGGYFNPSFMFDGQHIVVGIEEEWTNYMKIPAEFDLGKPFRVCLRNCVGSFSGVILTSTKA